MEDQKVWYKRAWVWIGLIFLGLIFLGLILFLRQTYIYYEQIKSGEVMSDFGAERQSGQKQVSEYEKTRRLQLMESARGKYEQPFLGKEDAAHEIVEFVDFGCPYCKQASKELHLLADARSDVKIIVRDFPIKELHADAENAAVAALCIWKNEDADKYWKFYDLLFANQDMQDLISLRTYAQRVGVRLEDFDRCLQNQAVVSQVKLSILAGEELGVQATPTFFVDGKMYEGVLTLELFGELLGVEDER